MESSTWYVIKQRLAWIKMHERGVPVTQVCHHYGISRKTFYKWWRRYQPVAMPKQNGKVERLHRTLDEECLNSRIFRKPASREHSLCRWLYFYNYQRPHSALGWLTPLQKLQTFPLYQSVIHV